MSHPAEHLPSFDPYYRQYQELGTSSGSHLHHDPFQLGYRPLYSPSARPGWSGRSFAEDTTESLHASIAQIIAEVKGLAAHVTSLCERKAEHSEKTNQILTHIKRIENQVNQLEGGMCARGLSGGSRSVSSEHPLPKVHCDLISHLTFILKTFEPACGPYDFFSDVRTGRVQEQGEMHE